VRRHRSASTRLARGTPGSCRRTDFVPASPWQPGDLPSRSMPSIPLRKSTSRVATSTRPPRRRNDRPALLMAVSTSANASAGTPPHTRTVMPATWISITELMAAVRAYCRRGVWRGCTMHGAAAPCTFRQSSHSGLMTPCKQLLQPQAMPACHFGNPKFARIRLGDDPRLHLARPTPVITSMRPMLLALAIKRKVTYIWSNRFRKESAPSHVTIRGRQIT
jgi:hypothetical protein